MQSIKKLLAQETLLFVFAFLFSIVAIVYPKPLNFYIHAIDFNTILTLFALIIITTGFKDSGYFDRLAWGVLKKLKYERPVAVFMVVLSILLSTFLTNDITLFIVVPLTLSLNNIVENDLRKLLILEAIGVNAGSLLTPIGNPQNIYLWHIWNVNFVHFVLKMLPLFVFMSTGILFLTTFTFYREEIVFKNQSAVKPLYNRKLFYISSFAMVVFLFSIIMKMEIVVSPLVFMLYLIFSPGVLKHTDWLLLVLFVVIFMLFDSLASIPFINSIITGLSIHSRKDVFLFSALLSQVMSNVPAAVLASKFYRDTLAIAYGVSVGGVGLIIGSIANIIVVRLSGMKGLIKEFHRYAIPFFIFTTLVVYLFLSI